MWTTSLSQVNPATSVTDSSKVVRGFCQFITFVYNLLYLFILFVCAEAMFAHFHSVMARIDIAYKLDIVEKVQRITAPTLIVHGTDDHFTKKDSYALYKLISNSELQSLPGGHLPHVTSPKKFAHIITEFVSRKVTNSMELNKI
jgi:pimeloyl-ACP methyl ester carboxylesterase